MKKKTKDIFLYMAPLQGVTNCTYRSTYSRFFNGYDRAIAPFIASCSAKKINTRNLRDIMPNSNKSKFLLVPQILSKNSLEFLVMAKAMQDLGYDHINWNMGCPHPMVRKKMRGSGLLPYPEMIRAFLDHVKPNLSAKLSVKVRLGNENNSELSALMPIFDTYPLEEIIIHPRTGAQMYGGSVDLNEFRNCMNATKHKVIYNGDIDSLEIFKRLKESFPAMSGWMIGRGGIIDPFLPEKILGTAPESEGEKLERLNAFHNAILEEYSKLLSGPGHILDKMKQLWSYWRKAYIEGEFFYQKVCRIKKTDKYAKEVNSFFDKRPKLLI